MSSGNQPWASFCMATYRRPERLRATLTSILGQSFSDFEVIVTDNDPERSGEAVVRALADPRISYHANDRNLGMVGNFNRALSFATGTYVVMITDDDPVFVDMLATMNRTAAAHPGFGAYFGACEVDFQDEAVAAKYGRAPGRVRCLSGRPEDAIWTYDKEQFPLEYFSGRVFPYVLWSCGVVRREIALAIGGMPDYGSPFLTDFGYISLAGSQAGCCCVNTAVGFQAVHSENFGRRQTVELVNAVEGFHRYVDSRMSARPSWPAERVAMEQMLGRWFADHVKFLWKYHRDPAEQVRVLAALGRSARVPYLRSVMLRAFAQTAKRRVGTQLRRVSGLARGLVSKQ
jgi:glycosyltransferase involved in cell wall biosynthesis